jgi:hypothetical protein
MKLRICGLFAAVLAAPALATESRMETLGNPVAVFDETDVFTYPARANDYDLALVELGRAPDNDDGAKANAQAYGGILKKLGGSSVGVVLSREESLLSDPTLAGRSLVDSWLAASVSNEDEKAILPAPERPIDIFFGAQAGGRSGWGTRLTYASYKNEQKATSGPTDEDKYSADQLDLFFGYSTGEANHFDLGVGLGVLGTLKHSDDSGGVENSDSFKRGLELSLSGRHVARQSNGRSAYQLQLLNRSPKVEAKRGGTSESAKFNEMAALLKGGYTLTPGKAVEVSADLGLLYISSKGPVIDGGVGSSGSTAATPSMLASDEDVKRKTTALFTTLALETPIAGGVGLLGGMQYTIWGTIKTDDPISETETEQTVTQTSDFNLWSLGLFYELEALRVDATYRKAFLHAGPYFASGDETENPLMRISASYKL